MPITLDSIIPWGRSLDEYVHMFDLSDADLHGKILGCGDGPASFNSEMTARGYRVVSVDPVYQFSGEQLRGRIEAAYQQVLEQVRANLTDYVWDAIKSPEELGRLRMTAMRRFLDDFEEGQRAGRYRAEELPTLDFPDQAFDLALCSHFLFLFSAHLSLEFHCQAIKEMGRVAKEVRIFPLQTLAKQQSSYVAPVCEAMRQAGYAVEIRPTPYEFQRGANEMLWMTRLK